MADFTTYPNGEPIGRASGANAASLPAFTVYQNDFDAADRIVTNGDVCTEFVKIPAGSYVLGVQVNVLTPEAAVTVDVGDVTDPNGYVAAQSAAVAGRFAGAGAYLDTAGAMPTPVYYAAETWLQFTIAGANATVAAFRVSVMVANAG
jgi:hypothetical protein